MDQHPHYLTWMKNKYVANWQFQTSMMNTFSNSWEEQAFANDVAFIWPPRSYSCTFCKRKFRSAQALGGHMNVHRRDRARLKLSPDSQNEDLSLPNCNVNPNHCRNPDPSFPLLAQSPCIVSKSNTIPRRGDLRLLGECIRVDDEANLSIGLNVISSQNRLRAFEYSHERINNFKRLETNDLEMPYILKTCPNERIVQGLDLELRLGEPPNLKRRKMKENCLFEHERDSIGKHIPLSLMYVIQLFKTTRPTVNLLIYELVGKPTSLASIFIRVEKSCSSDE